MSLKLVIDNSQVLDAGVDPQEMEGLRAGFDEWMDNQGEVKWTFEKDNEATLSEERIIELQQQAQALNQMFVDRIVERRDRLNKLLVEERGYH